MQPRLNHTSYRNFHFNEFVADALRDNIGSKKQPLTSEKNEVIFTFKYQKFRGHGKPYDQTQSNTMAQSTVAQSK